MATLAITAITRARVAFPEMGTSIALDLLNDAHAEFLARYPLRQDVLTVPVTANTQEYLLTDTAIQVEAAYYYQDAVNVRQLDVVSQHEHDQMHPGWRVDAAGDIQGYYLAGDTSSGVIGFYPKPNDTTIAITGASSTIQPNPIVVTTASPHGLSNGAPVYIVDVVGNVFANGRHFAKVLGYTSTTFALYSNSGLTLAVSGSPAYVSGGYLIAVGSPAVQMFIRRNQVLGELDSLPSCLLTIEPYVYSICRRWTEMTLDPSEWQKWQRLEYEAIHKMELYLSERAGQSAAVLKPQYVRPRRVH
jgi:hypothetical protein